MDTVLKLTELEKSFNFHYAILKKIGLELLEKNLTSKEIQISDRLNDSFFNDLIDEIMLFPSGYISTQKCQFVIYVLGKYLSDKYIKEFVLITKDLTKYVFWFPTVKWRIKKELSVKDQKEIKVQINDLPECTGYLELIEWRIRINTKNGIKYIQPFTNKKINAETLEYSMRAYIKNEDPRIISVIEKYERKFSKLRRIKKYITEINKMYANLNKNLIILKG